MAENVLYYGDNLEILRRYIKDESVVLVYLTKTPPRIRLSRAVAARIFFFFLPTPPRRSRILQTNLLNYFLKNPQR